MSAFYRSVAEPCRTDLGLVLLGRRDLDQVRIRSRRFAQYYLAIHFHHSGVLFFLSEPFALGTELFFSSRLCYPQLVEIMLDFSSHDSFAKHERMVDILKPDLLASRIDLVAAVLLIPLGQGSCHVHFLDDVAPSDPGVVGAERDLAFLSRVRDYALFGAAEIVVEQVLKPH